MSKKKKPEFAVYDFETDPFLYGRTPKPFLGGFFDGRNYTIEWGENASLRMAEKAYGYPGTAYAHNGGRFDAIYMVDHLRLSRPIYFKRISNRIASLPFGASDLRDSYSLLPVPLARFQKDEIDYRWFEADRRNDYRSQIIEYMKGDLLYLHQTLAKFFEEYGVGITLANRAFSELRKRGIKPGRTTLAWDDEFRRFYFGGRVQALKPGEHSGSIQFIDINSAYPRAMMDAHWWGAKYSERTSLPKAGIEQCMIELTADSHGAFPFRTENGGLDFPNGKRRYHVTGWELIAGLETGRVEIERIHRVLVPGELQSFEAYVSDFAARKLEAEKAGDKTRREFNKLLMNSCYGKFCLEPRDLTENCLCPIGWKPPGEGWGHPVSVNLAHGWSEFERPAQMKPNPCYNVATGASITGWVRAFLLRSLHTVARPIYCDTDSIMCHGTGDLKLGNQLGEWKVEAKGDYAAIAGKKIYAFRTDTKETPELKTKYAKAKGYAFEDGSLWKTATKGGHLEPKEIVAVSKGEIRTWKNDAPTFRLAAPLTVKRDGSATAGERTMFISRVIKRTAQTDAGFDE